MRNYIVLLASTSLAACGGAGVQTVGSSPASGGGTVTGAGTTQVASTHTFVNPTEPKTYTAMGSVHSFSYKTNSKDADPKTAQYDPGGQYKQVYAGDSTTARNSAVTISYNPRDAIFDVVINQPNANVNQSRRFQDPLHRTAFGGQLAPQAGVPEADPTDGVNYLEISSQNDSPKDTTTFFYVKPGTTTKYVTFAGYVRNVFATADIAATTTEAAYTENTYTKERGTFVYGERSQNSVVPKTGNGTFTGSMFASLIYNPLLDTDSKSPTYFQWVGGDTTLNFNFAANTFGLTMLGEVGEPHFDSFTSRAYVLDDGATFKATGSGRIDLVNAGGFVGAFQSASFTQLNGTVIPVTIAGSSIDGAFFGPAAEEAAGSFRIVGGNPDERVDMLGVFFGKRP